MGSFNVSYSTKAVNILWIFLLSLLIVSSVSAATYINPSPPYNNLQPGTEGGLQGVYDPTYPPTNPSNVTFQWYKLQTGITQPLNIATDTNVALTTTTSNYEGTSIYGVGTSGASATAVQTDGGFGTTCNTGWSYHQITVGAFDRLERIYHFQWIGNNKYSASMYTYYEFLYHDGTTASTAQQGNTNSGVWFTFYNPNPSKPIQYLRLWHYDNWGCSDGHGQGHYVNQISMYAYPPTAGQKTWISNNLAAGKRVEGLTLTYTVAGGDFNAYYDTTGTGTWTAFTKSSPLTFARTEDFRLKFELTGEVPVISNVNFGFTGLVHQPSFDYTYTGVSSSNRMYTGTGTGSVSERLVPGDTWNLKVTESYNPTYTSYSTDVTVATSPTVVFDSLSVNRVTKTATYCFNVTSLNGAPSVNATIQYTENGGAPQLGSVTVVNTVGTQVCKDVVMNFGSEYVFKGLAYVSSGGYTAPTYYTFPELQSLYVGTPDIVDYDERDRIYDGVVLEDGLREGALYDLTSVYIETNISTSGLTLHWWDGDSWSTQAMSSASSFSYYTVSGLANGLQTLYITDGNGTVAEWVKPGLEHPLGGNRVDETKYVSFAGEPENIDYRIMFLGAIDYNTTAYEWCLDDTGNDIYQCYATGWWPDPYDVGQLERGGVIGPGLKDTGVLRGTLDSGRPYSYNFQREEFGGQNTETVSVENSTSYSIEPYYLYVNYTKLPGVERDNTRWYVKHSFNGVSPIEDYIQIPLNCWNYAGTYGDIVLRIKSEGHSLLSNLKTEPACYDGVSWTVLGNAQSGAVNHEALFTADPASRLVDGDYRWGATWKTDTNEWYWSGNSYARIYEEKMLWDAVGLPATTQYWWDDDIVVNNTIENYYFHFWMNNDKNGTAVELDNVNLFRWGIVEDKQSYWREDSDTLWVKANLTAGETYTFVIGEDDVEGYAEAPADVFLFLQDFRDITVNTELETLPYWQQVDFEDLGPSYIIGAEGAMYFYDADSADVDYYKTNFSFDKGVVLEIVEKDDPVNEEWPLEFGFYDGTNTVARIKDVATQDYFKLLSKVGANSYYHTANPAKNTIGSSTYTKHKLVWNSGLAQLVIGNTLQYQIDYNVPTTAMPLVLGNVYAGGTAAWNTAGRVQYLYVRKHVPSTAEPVVTCNGNVCSVYAPETVSDYQLEFTIPSTLGNNVFVYKESFADGFNAFERTKVTQEDVFEAYGYPYWRETNDASNSKVWTKVTMDAGDSVTLKISDAFPYAEDPQEVFVFFDGYDDVTDGTLSPARWANYDATNYHVNSPAYPNKLLFNWTGAAWGSYGPWTVANFVRTATTGYVLEHDYMALTGTGANRMFGWHDTTAGDEYANLIYGLYDNNGVDIRTYEDNVQRTVNVQNFARGTNYKIRLTAKTTAESGALYEISADGGNTWTLLYNSTYSNEATLKIGSDDYGVDYVQDSTRIRKYLPGEPVSVSCSNNECVLTANQDVVDYQVQLQTNVTGDLNIINKDLTITLPAFFGDTKEQTLIAGYKEFTPIDLSDNLGGEIYDFGLQIEGQGTNQRIGKYQPGFVIFNLPSNSVLLLSDTDGDALNDYEELYVYYTNPLSSDSDEGGEEDRAEILAGRNPLLFYDDVVKVNEVVINELYPEFDTELSCSFNVTNDDTYNNIDVTVSWKKAVDNNAWFEKYLNDDAYVDIVTSTSAYSEASNGTVSYTLIPAQYTHMFTDGGVGTVYSTGWYLVSTINSPPIPAPYDVQKLVMTHCANAGKYANNAYSYTRWYYRDATPTTNTGTVGGCGDFEHYNPNPGKPVLKIEVYGHDDQNYGWYLNNIRVWGKNGYDGYDEDDDNFVTGNIIWPDEVDRFTLSYELSGGVVQNFYDDDDNYENYQLAYYQFTSKSVYDSYLFNIHGAQGTPSFRADRFGSTNSSLDIVSNESVFVIASNTKFNALPELSIVAQLNLDSLPASEAVIVERDQNFRLTVDNLGQLKFYTGDDWAGTILTTTNVLTTGVDYEIIAVYDGLTKNIYVNGVADPSIRTVTGANLGTTTNRITFGGHWDGSNYNQLIDGALDDVQFFSIGMTEEDVAHYKIATTGAPYDVWNDWVEFSSEDEQTITDTTYLRLMMMLDESEPFARQIKFGYHPTQVYTDVNDYDYTFYNINRGQLYTTTAGTGSVTADLDNYDQWKCYIDVFNQNVHKQQGSEKVSVYPLENLNVTYPDTVKVDNEPFFTSFSVTDLDGGIVCDLNANGAQVGSYGYVETNTNYEQLGLTVEFEYLITRMAMSEGCLGDITLAPVPDYPLEVCLEDWSGMTVPGSCKTYTSGEFGVGDVLSTGQIERSVLGNSYNYRFRINWNRIGYVDMANPELDGNFDHGQSEFGDHNHVCLRLSDDADTVCSGTTYQYYWASTQAACNHGGGSDHGTMVLDYGNSFTDSYQLYSTNTCTPGTEKTNEYVVDNIGYYSTTTERRVYEGYWRTGGTDANLACAQALGQKRDYDCGQCDTFNLRWYPTTCTAGTEDTYPSGLCTYAGNYTTQSDFFTYQESYDNSNIIFTEKLQAEGNVSWHTASNWPVVDDEYLWNIECSAIGQNYTITSENRTYNFDLAPPMINSYASNENILYPEIGDTITLSVDVSDDDNVAMCRLLVDDNGAGLVPVGNYTVNAQNDTVDMSFQVRPYSIRDAVNHPDYFRTGNVVWTKLSLDAGETITIVMDNTNNVFDTYPQNGEAVFPFFEPFDSNPIDSETWEPISTETTTLTYSSGEMTFYDEDASNKDFFITTASFNSPAILEWYQRDYTAEEWPLEVGFGRGTSNTIGKTKIGTLQDAFVFKTYKYGVITESTSQAVTDSYTKYKVVWKDGESSFWKDDALQYTLTSNIPTVGLPIVIGDTTAGGTSGTDTKGTIDWMFVRQYSDNMPTVSCNANICTVTAGPVGFTNLQVPLQTTYLTGDISLSYAEDKSEVFWTAECFDDAGNAFQGAAQSFNVKDNTAPLITLDEDNGFLPNNVSAHSNAVGDLNLAVDYFDYNLFQAYERIDCDFDGLIYEWEDIDVEVFNYDATYQNTDNQSQSYDVYDTTFSTTTISNSGQLQGWVGQTFDSFYYVSSLQYQAETQDARVVIQTYDGVGWKTVRTHARATSVYTQTVDINDSIAGIRFYFDDTTSASSVNKVYYMKYLYENGLSQNGALFEHTQKVDTTGLMMQRCVLNASASDDHTDEIIPDYDVTQITAGLEYDTDVDIKARVVYAGNPYDVASKSTTKQTDRYTFQFDFLNKSLSRTFKLQSLNGDLIYNRPNSKYDGHFVIWNSETKDGNWVDFEEIANPETEFEYDIVKVNDYEYDITVSVVMPTNSLTPEQQVEAYGIDTYEFFSIGGTNIQQTSWIFYIGGAVNVTGVNVFDNSKFTNYTVAVSTVSGTPGATFNRTYNSSVTNYVEGLPEGVYDLHFTHPQYFDQTYRVNITTQFDDCFQQSADIGGTCPKSTSSYEVITYTNGGTYVDDPGWVNLGNAIDANWSTYSSVTNTVGFKYYYMTYDMVADAVPVWEVAVGATSNDRLNITPPSECLDDADNDLKLRVGYEDSLAQNTMVFQCSDDGAWVTMTDIEGSVPFANKLWEEGVHWKTIGANRVTQNYESYQAKITFQLRDVKTQELLDDLNMSIRIGNFTNSQYFPVGTYDLTVLVDAAPANILAKKTRYIDLNKTYTFTYKQEQTYVLDMNFYSVINLYDEKTLQRFDMTKPDKVEFLVFCQDSTRIQELTNNTQTVEITCAYEKFKFLLTYGTSGYYRTFLTPPEDAFNQSIYLIEISSTSYIYSSFTIDDLLGQYDNPKIYINKLIENNKVQITADYTDVEGKIGAFLIENQEYLIEIHSDNQPIREMGIYAADVGGDKTLRVYDISLATDSLGYYNNVVYGADIQQEGNESYVVGRYVDTENATSSVTFRVHQGNTDGPVLYTFTGSPTYSSEYNGYAYEFQQLLPPSYVNTTLSIDLNITHASGQRTTGFFLFKNYRIPLPEDISQEALNWFFLLFLSVVAIIGTIKTANILSIILIGFATLFIIFGWLGLSMGVLLLSALISLIAILKEGEKDTK